eukprot:jgi/Bigna1/46624/estExt_Genewise1.C_60054
MTSADIYFDSNSHFMTHEELLKDRVRTRAFLRATVNNKFLFKDKIVLDVGAGTGILSMFAVKAGAKHVYAVESSGIIHIAEKIIKANKMLDKITFVKGKMEEVELPVKEVDIILSDWMGYMLIQESMISTVIYARDNYDARWQNATMYICGIEDADYKEQRIDFWDNVYGFNMSCMKEGSLTEPLIDSCTPEQVITSLDTIHKLDLNTATVDDIKIASDFSLTSGVRDFCHALVLYFDVSFSKSHKDITFSTGPRQHYTHWKQSVLYLDEPIPLNKGEKITGKIKMHIAGKKGEQTVIDLKTSFTGKTADLELARIYKYG